jgi:hypothetical protein
MITPASLCKIVARRFGRRERRPPPVRVAGIPDGIHFETLEKLSLQHTGAKLKKVSYVHVSGWKRAGAYRLFLENGKGHEWRLIYKNALYDPDHIPALKNFPIMPGPPEFVVYAHAKGDFARYLPEVYQCTETVTGQQYQYLLEDLADEYIPLSDKRNIKDKFRVVAELPSLHSAMQEWSAGIDQSLLVHYDSSYSLALRQYAGKVLVQFAQQNPSDRLREACDQWDSIMGLSLDRIGAGIGTNAMIHGDANGANILVHKSDPDKYKFIDWEWAGFGLVFSDAVSLFRRADAATNKKVLATYLKNSAETAFDDPASLYEWCRLERGMLDAAYIAAQHMGSSELEQRRKGWAPQFVEHSLKTMLSAYQKLV